MYLAEPASEGDNQNNYDRLGKIFMNAGALPDIRLVLTSGGTAAGETQEAVGKSHLLTASPRWGAFSLQKKLGGHDQKPLPRDSEFVAPFSGYLVSE